MRPRRAARRALPAIVVLFLSGWATLAAAQEPGQAKDRVKTTVTLTQQEMMVGAKDDFATWDLSVAVGTYVQSWGARTAAGRILDLGALQMPDGSTYPILMAEGQGLVVRTGSSPQTIAKVTNAQNLVLAPKDTVWTSPDGKTTVRVTDGTFYLVLDPKGFPGTKRVIGIADSTSLYLYPKD
jgi:hypothetical protein